MHYRECDIESFEDDIHDLVETIGSHEPKMTARQRIEIAKEELSLRSMLADFDDWDELDGFENITDFESFGDYYVDRVS